MANTYQLFFGRSIVSQSWRANTLAKAQAKLDIGIIWVRVDSGSALGESSSLAACSAVEVAKRVTSTHTLRISDDFVANDVAVGQLVWTLVAFQGGDTPIIPSALDPYFAVGNPSKARDLVIRDYDSAMKIMEMSYDYETAKKLAVERRVKYDLSENVPSFTEDSYKTPSQFTSANEIRRMCMLSKEDLHAEVRAFIDENFPNLMKNSTEYTMAFWQRVVSILKSGSTLDDMADLMVNGHGCVVPVIIDVGGEAKKSHAFFTMGTPAMLEKGWMSRFICPGMSNNHRGSRYNNKHSVPYIVNHLMSPTHCIIIDTNASRQNSRLSNDNDGIYASRAIMIGNERRIIRRIYEGQRCSKLDDKHNRSELVRYDVKLSDRTYAHHQFMLIYATKCGIGHTSYEYIFNKLRSMRARLNMTRECVNPGEQWDGDHCFHRLMLISNSIYFCFPTDHTTNRCLSVHQKKAGDWNYTLARREYVCGN